jgi:hypothetical protein
VVPKGYWVSTSPHLLLQPGNVMLAVAVATSAFCDGCCGELELEQQRLVQE